MLRDQLGLSQWCCGSGRVALPDVLDRRGQLFQRWRPLVAGAVEVATSAVRVIWPGRRRSVVVHESRGESIEVAQLEADADTTGRHPSVLALATRLGLANTTFRRYFPDIVHELGATPAPPSDQARDSTRYAQLKQDNAALRRDNQDLAEHLDLTIAHIQRLTLEANQLRQQLRGG